jgi:hypothetical protein
MAPGNSLIGSAEETGIRQLIVNGKFKTALDRAKELHKARGSAASEALLIDAYAARIQSLQEQNLALEAKSLLELVRERYPTARARLDELSATSAARAGALDELLAPLNHLELNHLELNHPELSAERRAAIEMAVQNGVADLAALAACAALPAEHSLRVAAAALDAALTAVTSAPVTDEEIALPAVSRRSPLAPWKLLVRAIAYFYRGEDDACRECLGAIKPESAPARLAPAMHAMLTPGAKPAAPLSPAAVALVARTTATSAALRNELERLDRAFADFANDAIDAEGPSEGQILKFVRSAMQECRRSMPEQMETLKRLIYVRGSMNELDRPRLLAALDGMPRRDASFYRALAHGMETTGDPDNLAAACEYWDEFRQHAVRESWFAANGVEVATLYLHMAGVLQKIPGERLWEFQQASRSDRKLGPEVLYFLFPEKLYARACAVDPHPEAFAQWLQWAARQSVTEGEDVAKAWHKIRPMDIEPLLHLLQEAEKRNAFPTALTYLDQAERIDAVHSVVRAARLRLLAGSALRHVQQKKPHLAAEKLDAMAALPQSRQGDRPAFLAALSYLIAVETGDATGTVAARAEAGRLLGSDIAAGMLVCGVSAGTKRGVTLPPVQALSKAERSALPVSLARVAVLAKDLGIVRFELPAAYINEAANQFARASGSLDTSQLRTLGETALASGHLEFAYAASAAGLSRGGPNSVPAEAHAGAARFLLLRAQSLPERQSDRRAICAAAAAELARAQRDMEVIDGAVELARGAFGPEPLSLTPDQAGEVLRKEKAASKFNSRGPDYASLLPRMQCDCPKCRRARGEMPGPFDVEDDDDDDDFDDFDPIDEAEMERLFNQHVPKGMPPEISRMLFEVMKEAYLNGESLEEILSDLMAPERSRGKGRKGRRK